MSVSGDFTNCKVILYNEKTGVSFAEAVIMEYDRHTLTITIDASCLPTDEPEKISVLIFYHNAIVEFKGVLRKQSIFGKREISLYQGQTKEHRTAVRYNSDIPAQVGCLIVQGKKLPFKKPLDVTVLNVSTAGVLIRTTSTIFHVGTGFQLELNIAGSNTIIHSCVIRVNRTENGAYDCGCQFLSIS